MTKVAIYTRISRDRSGAEEGVGRQEALCREYAKANGLTIVAVESDNDVSAYRERNRPGYRSLLKRVENDQVDGILVWHTDRLYRRMVDLIDLIALVRRREAHKSAIKIYSVKAGEVDLSSPAGILQAEIMGAVAGHEVLHKAERQIAKALELAQAGAWSGNRTPLGYRRDPSNKHALLIHIGEAELLRQARRRILAGHGVTDTTRWAKQQLEGSDSLRKTLTPSNFRNILMSPTIAGYRVHVPQSERDQWDQRRKEGKKRAGDYAYADHHMFKGQWDPIFSDEEWKSISSFLTKPDRVNPGRAPKSLLSGVLTCYRCGSVLGYSRTAGSSPSYKCSNDSLTCPGLGISAKPIEEYIVRLVGLLLETSPFEVGQPSVKSLPDMTAMDRLLAQKQRWMDAFGIGDISPEEFRAQMEPLRASIQQLQETHDRALELEARDVEIHDSIERWETLDVAERRTVLKWIFVKVTILPTKKIWGRNFQPIRVVPWYRSGAEPSLEGPLEELRVAEDAQMKSVAARKEAEEVRRAARLGKGGLK